MSQPLLSLRGVEMEYATAAGPLRILKGVDLDLAAGETVAITGPSGSGKSTLLGVMAGLEPPTRGSVLFRGEDAGAWSEDGRALWRRRHVGFIFQGFRLIDSLTALENALLPLELLGRSPEEAREGALRALKELGIADRAGHLPSRLSGGEQQRAAIARAYAHGPDLLFADEPTGSLDRDSAGAVLDALLEANAAREAALVVVTHDPAVAARMKRALKLDGGRLVPA